MLDTFNNIFIIITFKMFQCHGDNQLSREIGSEHGSLMM